MYRPTHLQRPIPDLMNRTVYTIAAVKVLWIKVSIKNMSHVFIGSVQQFMSASQTRCTTISGKGMMEGKKRGEQEQLVHVYIKLYQRLSIHAHTLPSGLDSAPSMSHCERSAV